MKTHTQTEIDRQTDRQIHKEKEGRGEVKEGSGGCRDRRRNGEEILSFSCLSFWTQNSKVWFECEQVSP